MGQHWTLVSTLREVLMGVGCFAAQCSRAAEGDKRFGAVGVGMVCAHPVVYGAPMSQPTFQANFKLTNCVQQHRWASKKHNTHTHNCRLTYTK